MLKKEAKLRSIYSQVDYPYLFEERGKNANVSVTLDRFKRNQLIIFLLIIILLITLVFFIYGFTSIWRNQYAFFANKPHKKVKKM